MSNKVIPIKPISPESKAKIDECIRTKTVYVKVISDKQLAALQAKGFTVIMR